VETEPHHIFVINGSPVFLDVMRDLLQEEHYNGTTTNSAPRSFEQEAAQQPSMLIVDLVIGQKAGWKLLEQLNADAVTSQIPVLVVSTDPAQFDRAEAHASRYGGSRLLNKPFDLDAVLEAVRELIGPA
jgi:CheY-like chemotaxis protein